MGQSYGTTYQRPVHYADEQIGAAFSVLGALLSGIARRKFQLLSVLIGHYKMLQEAVLSSVTRPSGLGPFCKPRPSAGAQGLG